MTLLDKILSAPDDARISILYPCKDGRGAESIGDAKELREALATPTLQELSDELEKAFLSTGMGYKVHVPDV